ncbi:MAG: prolipoprotein diacylglyceryl transferase [Pseudobdellovibrionaceae bacterium]
MIHQFDPFIYRISGEFGLRWYGFSYLLGFLFAYIFISWMCSRQKVGLHVKQVSDFITWGAVGILLGGRLGYCLFYDPSLFVQFKGTLPFWGVFALNEGGMSAHGGILGLILACILFAAKTGVSQLYLFDLVAVTAPVGIFFGRIANFFNGELVGRAAPADYTFGIKFPHDILNWPAYEFSKLASLSNVTSQLGVSNEDWLRWVDQYRTQPEAQNQVTSMLYQIIDQVQQGNVVVIQALSPLLELRHPSQLYAAAGEGLFIFLILFLFWRSPRTPGVVGALFLVLYGIARFVGEFFRMPDPHVGYQWLDLTRGQWLSLVVMAIGLGLLFVWGRREALPFPGWGKAQSVKIHRRI